MPTHSKNQSELTLNYLPLQNPKDLDPLMERIGDASYVLLGEASHGTHEYYTWRAAITKRLIQEKGFSFIGVEGDWPDCFQINRWIKDFADSERSEEHTSELQSRGHLVCRLLLEKKNDAF